MATFKNWSIKLSAMSNQVASFFNLIEWDTANITVTPETGMTFTITGTSSFKYFRILDTVFFSASSSGTIGGAVAKYLAFSLPFPISSEIPEYAFTAGITDGGNVLSGVGLVNTSKESINVYKGNGAVWTAGAATFRCSGFYKRRLV